MRTIAPLAVLALLAGVFAASFFGADVAAANRWMVPGDFASIQAAVNASSSGDTIVVKGGPYYESVAVIDIDDLTILGKKAVIDPPDGWPGLYVEDSDGVTVSGFRIEAANSYGLLCDASSNTVFSKCVVVDSAMHGIAFGTCTDCTVTKCEVVNAAGDAVSVFGCTGVTVVKNTVEGGGGHGVSLSFQEKGKKSNDCLVSKNRVEGVDGVGVGADGDDNVIEKNRISGTGEAGIALAASAESDGNVIEKNRITDVEGDGVNLNSNATNTLVLKNRIDGCDGAGASQWGSGEGGVFEGNKMKGLRGEIGLRVGGSTERVVKNKVTVEGSMAGIYVPGSSMLISGNKVGGTGMVGIAIEGGSNTVEKNRAKGFDDVDLLDTVGTNTYTKNRFGTTDIAPPP